MKKSFLKSLYIIFVLFLFFSSCSAEDDNSLAPSYVFSDEEIPYNVIVLDDTREIVMTNDRDWEIFGLYYFNVIKRKNNEWHMWYASKESTLNGDYDSNFCYAHSINGKDWLKNIPKETSLKNNILIHGNGNQKKGWVETYVFIDKNDLKYPYKIIYTAIDFDGFEKTFLAESIDGIEWINSKIIWKSKYDSQFSVNIMHDGNYIVFLRIWDKHHSNRQIGYAIISPEGKTILAPTAILSGSLYNSAASHIKNSDYILFPTIYNSNNQNINIKIGFLINGKAGLTKQDITSQLFQNDPTNWAIVSPGLIPTDNENEYWLYYYGRPNSHNQFNVRTITTYYRVKILIKNKI